MQAHRSPQHVFDGNQFERGHAGDQERTLVAMTRRTVQSRFMSSISKAASLTRAGQPEQALHVLAHTLEGANVFDPAHAVYVEGLLRLGRRSDALDTLKTVARLQRDSADASDALAFLSRNLDLHEQAHEMYREAARRAPNDARHWFNLAASARTIGHLEEALAACEQSLALDPALLSAVLLRSEIGVATADHNHVDELVLRLERDQTSRAQMFIGYALGKELHELGEFARAFQAFSMGATARRSNLQYDVAQDERKMDRIRAAFGSESLTPHSLEQRTRDVFIIGLPRSGTTLVERILGAAPGARSNGETNNFSSALMSCLPAGTTDQFADSAAVDPHAVAQRYEHLALFGGRSDVVIEKLPINFLYVGAIARCMPSARIVWVRRHPMDSCFAMFRTLFGAGYPFSYEFEELARYYAAYERLMEHWARVAPDRMIAVDYEDLVTNPTDAARRVVTHCGLPWSDALVDITRNQAPSLTASAAQIRFPIHARSAGIWQHYAPWLDRLQDHLQQSRGIVQ